jgi:hypothetical protein
LFSSAEQSLSLSNNISDLQIKDGGFAYVPYTRDVTLREHLADPDAMIHATWKAVVYRSMYNPLSIEQIAQRPRSTVYYVQCKEGTTIGELGKLVRAETNAAAVWVTGDLGGAVGTDIHAPWISDADYTWAYNRACASTHNLLPPGFRESINGGKTIITRGDIPHELMVAANMFGGKPEFTKHLTTLREVLGRKTAPLKEMRVLVADVIQRLSRNNCKWLYTYFRARYDKRAVGEDGWAVMHVMTPDLLAFSCTGGFPDPHLKAFMHELEGSGCRPYTLTRRPLPSAPLRVWVYGGDRTLPASAGVVSRRSCLPANEQIVRAMTRHFATENGTPVGRNDVMWNWKK